MSWDATFYVRADGRLVQHRDWNYTHNTNVMISDVLETLGKEPEQAWWDQDRNTVWWNHLDGLDGEASADLLDKLIEGLTAAPEKYRAMNPDNGWGDFDSLVVLLKEMHATCDEFPSGEWSVSG